MLTDLIDLVWGRGYHYAERAAHDIMWPWMEGGSGLPKQPHLRENGYEYNQKNISIEYGTL